MRPTQRNGFLCRCADCAAERRRSANDVHITPINDLREHEYTTTCWCQPSVEEPLCVKWKPLTWGRLVIHHSADGRELVEQHGIQ